MPNIKRVVDAKRGIRIEVTENDCMPYGQKTLQSCAIALAAKRYHHFDGAIITRSMAYLVRGSRAYRYSISPKAAQQARQFDTGKGFKPGIYSMQVPSHRLGWPHKNGDHDHKRKPRGKVHVSRLIRQVL